MSQPIRLRRGGQRPELCCESVDQQRHGCLHRDCLRTHSAPSHMATWPRGSNAWPMPGTILAPTEAVDEHDARKGRTSRHPLVDGKRDAIRCGDCRSDGVAPSVIALLVTCRQRARRLGLQCEWRNWSPGCRSTGSSYIRGARRRAHGRTSPPPDLVVSESRTWSRGSLSVEGHPSSGSHVHRTAARRRRCLAGAERAGPIGPRKTGGSGKRPPVAGRRYRGNWLRSGPDRRRPGSVPE